MKIRPFCRLLAVSFLAVLTLSDAHAQANTFEIAAGGGVADYFGNGAANNTKGLFEATALYNFAPFIGAGFEYTYSPVESYNQSFNGVVETGNDHLQHFGGVIHAAFANGAHVQPYVAARFGGLRETASATAAGNGQSASASQSVGGGYVGTGLGVNLLATGGFGFRPELRYEYLTESGSHLHEVDFTVSVFYRFGTRSHK